MIRPFLANLIFKQNPHVIPAAIQNTVNVDFVPICPVENHVVSTDKKTIIAFYFRDSGKRCAQQRMVIKQSNCFCNFAYHGNCRLRFFVIPHIHDGIPPPPVLCQKGRSAHGYIMQHLAVIPQV